MSIAHRILTLVALAHCVGLQPVSAETARTNVPAVDSAPAALGAVSPEVLARLKGRVLESAVALDQFLAGGGEEVVAGWHAYLKWSDMQAELANERPDTKRLQEILIQYRRNTEGIEHAPFLAMRASLREYLDAQESVLDLSAPTGHPTFLADLIDRVDRYASHPTGREAHALGKILNRLESTQGLRGPTLDTLRQRIDRPNAYAHVSTALIDTMFSRDVQETTEIRQQKDGMVTRGSAKTEAHVNARLEPSRDRAVIDVHLAGTTRAPRTVSTQGQVTVRSSFVTNLEATKRIFMSAEGISCLPVRAACRTAMQIYDIEANRRVVERIAERRAQRLLPEAESDVSRTAERQIREQLETESAKALVEANHVYQTGFRLPMIRYGAFPQHMQFSTDAKGLDLEAKLAGAKQLGAPCDPPAIDPAHDMVFVFHESMINNYGELIFGGKVLSDRQWLNLLNIMTGSSPRPLWVHDRTERWSVTMAYERPLTVQFDDGQFVVTLRAARVVRGEQSMERPVSITATFRVSMSIDGPTFFRQGNVKVQLIDGGRPDGETQRSLLSFAQKKFRAVLPEELHLDGLTPPSGGSLGQLRRFKPKEFRLEESWMTMGYQVAPLETTK